MNLSGFRVRWYHTIIAAIIVFFAGFLSVGGLGCPTIDPYICSEGIGVESYRIVAYLLPQMFIFGIVLIFTVASYFGYRYLCRCIDNPKIIDLGGELGVKKGDVQRMKVTRTGLMMAKAVLAFFISLLYMIVFWLGSDLKTLMCPHVIGYPYWRSMVLLPVIPTDRKKSRITVFLLSAITLLTIINSSPVFGQQCVVPLYGVFSKKKRR